MAAKLTKYPLRGLNTKEAVLHVGSFTPDVNTSYPHNVPLTKVNGAQFTVTKTAAGTYVVKFLDSYVQCVQFDTDIVGQTVLPSGAAGVALNVVASQYGFPAANQVQLRFYNPATALSSSDITPVEPSSIPTGCLVQFCATFRVTGSPD